MMPSTALDNVRIVLVGTTHPGNIGAAARAMKTMGFSRLGLVAPKIFPGAEATARAAGADDVLAAATLHESLVAAVADCEQVYATSARLRRLGCPVVTPEQAARQILADTGTARTAIVFGRERSGLSNEELDACNRMIVIPTNPDFASLNLASAVQVVCYEFSRVLHEVETAPAAAAERVSSEELEHLYAHLQECLVEIGFLDLDKPRRLMRRLRRLFNRAGLDRNEYNILRGILTAVQASVRKS